MIKPLQFKKIHGRRAVIDMLVEFVIAVVLLTVVFLVVKVALAVGFKEAGVSRTAVLESPAESFACDYWLMNFLRAKSQDGKVFADLLTKAETDGDKKQAFITNATDYFEKNYVRGYALQRWSLKAEDVAMKPILSIGYQDKRLPRRCYQKILSENGPIKVILGVDY